MIAKFKDWLVRLDPMIPGQAYLVVMTAAGLADFGQVMFCYAVEIVVVLVVSLLFFSPTWRLVLRRLLELFVKGAIATILVTIIFAFFHGVKNDTQLDRSLADMGRPAVLAAIYCAMHFSLVLQAIWRDADRARQWVRLVIVPEWSLWFAILVALFAGQLAFGLIDDGSVSTHRVLATVLTALAGTLRVVFTRLIAPATWNDADDWYLNFMNPKTLS